MEVARTQNRSAGARMVGRKAEEEAGADGAPGVAGTETSSWRELAPWMGTARGICPCGPSVACGIGAAAAAGEELAAAAARVLELEIASCLEI